MCTLITYLFVIYNLITFFSYISISVSSILFNKKKKSYICVIFHSFCVIPMHVCTMSVSVQTLHLPDSLPKWCATVLLPDIMLHNQREIMQNDGHVLNVPMAWWGPYQFSRREPSLMAMGAIKLLKWDSRRLFGTNNWVASSFVWASWVTQYNLSFIMEKYG